jgi:hypothetical protein
VTLHPDEVEVDLAARIGRRRRPSPPPRARPSPPCWAIADPEGTVIAYTVRAGRQDAIGCYLRSSRAPLTTWRDVAALGYRCVKVRVVPVEEGGGE